MDTQPLPGLSRCAKPRPPRRPPVLPAAVQLLQESTRGLASAQALEAPHERYAAAHLAALRAAAAVLASRAQPLTRRRPMSVWALLPQVAPELSEWAAFFASGARKRAAAEAGLTRSVTARDADDLVRSAQTFRELVIDLLRYTSRSRAG